MNVLTIDIGGTTVKMLATGEKERRRFKSGRTLTPRRMVTQVKDLARGWRYDVIAIGYPGVVIDGRPALEPHNLGRGWVGFDYRAAFRRPVKILNDAAMQALGSYQGGVMLFVGLGTGLGSAIVCNDNVIPMELGHLPYRNSTYEDYVGDRGLKKRGRAKWNEHVDFAVARLVSTFHADDVVLGGGNAKELTHLPPHCRLGDNANAFLGGFRMWEQESSQASRRPPAPPRHATNATTASRT
jgi:polyphosphate glucokinase